MTVPTSDEPTGAKMEERTGSQYALTVLNQNASFQQLALFQTIPDIAGPSTDPLWLAWMVGGAAPGSVHNPSRATFVWETTYHVAVGYIQDLGSWGNPRSFMPAATAEVMVDSRNALKAAYLGSFPRGAPTFPDQPTDGTAGLISVQSDSSIPSSMEQKKAGFGLYAGMTMSGRPTAMAQLEPNRLYQFTPRPSYYISAGSFRQGQVIDKEVWAAAFEVQFSGVTDRTIIFTQAGAFQNG